MQIWFASWAKWKKLEKMQSLHQQHGWSAKENFYPDLEKSLLQTALQNIHTEETIKTELATPQGDATIQLWKLPALQNKGTNACLQPGAQEPRSRFQANQQVLSCEALRPTTGLCLLTFFYVLQKEGGATVPKPLRGEDSSRRNRLGNYFYYLLPHTQCQKISRGSSQQLKRSKKGERFSCDESVLRCRNAFCIWAVYIDISP